MRFILTLCLTAVIGAAAAQRAPIKFEEYDLDNGLHVILHEDHTAPVAMVSVMYHVGSKNEDPNRTGMAHFFEHLLFEGSENIGRGEFFKYIQKNKDRAGIPVVVVTALWRRQLFGVGAVRCGRGRWHGRGRGQQHGRGLRRHRRCVRRR